MCDTEKSERNRALIQELDMTELEVFHINYEYEFGEPTDDIVTFRRVFNLKMSFPEVNCLGILKILLKFIRIDMRDDLHRISSEQELFVTQYSREIE
jgi:hypothetical protein